MIELGVTGRVGGCDQPSIGRLGHRRTPKVWAFSSCIGCSSADHNRTVPP
jgi:hypothetical protein